MSKLRRTKSSTRLSALVSVEKSPVHGRGVFARGRLRAGAFIGTFAGTPTSRNGVHVLWVLGPDGSRNGIRGETVLRFLNHSADPNAEFLGEDLHAIRNIQPGCEIRIHYGDDWEGDDWEGDD